MMVEIWEVLEGMFKEGKRVVDLSGRDLLVLYRGPLSARVYEVVEREVVRRMEKGVEKGVR